MPRILYELNGCQDSGMDTKAAVPVAVRRRNLRSLPIKAERETEMRKTLRASILLLALSGSAYAGIISNDNPQPPPPTTTATATTETGGEPANATATAPTTEPTATEIVVNLLQTALAIL